jgi:hypothetical protein
VKNPPGKPEQKNALAVPSERCTDDVNNQAEGTQKKQRDSSPLRKRCRVPCETFPREPTNKNAVAVPFERCTDDVNNQAEYSVKNLIANS